MLKRSLMMAVAIGSFMIQSPLYADTTVSLASQMDGNGFISENAVTGSFAQINLDPDGLYNLADPAQLFANIDVFPNEENFAIGSFDYDETLVTGLGVETVSITNLDTSGFWTSGSATSDVSDVALDLWLFDSPNSFAFDPLDAGDTATFTNGILTSVDAITAAQYSMVDGGGNTVTWNGSLTMSGDTITFAFNDTQTFDTGVVGVVPSTFAMNLTGTIGAVTAIPEPSFAGILFIGGGLLAVRRRRTR
ncbi:MAG: PEP-CTERM sorting domain-containing protein [Planctomycetota bacterium]